MCYRSVNEKFIQFLRNEANEHIKTISCRKQNTYLKIYR
jgi:hypothetical protein